jgi:hypothetical protein
MYNKIFPGYQLTRLVAREYFVIQCRRESYKSFSITCMTPLHAHPRDLTRAIQLAPFKHGLRQLCNAIFWQFSYQYLSFPFVPILPSAASCFVRLPAPLQLAFVCKPPWDWLIVLLPGDSGVDLGG